MSARPTKEQIVAALALVVAGLTIRARVAGPPAAGALPRVPPPEPAAEVSKDEIEVAKPRLLEKSRATEGRDPFAASDIWEDATPVALPLPPELPDEWVVPAVTIGGGRARAPRAPRLAALPRRVKEAPPQDASASDAMTGSPEKTEEKRGEKP
jgi:hypothetical protein